MRALVISDTHFGAWTGRDLLREDFFLERLEPELEGIDELIVLGDLFDFLFGSVGEAVDAAGGLLGLIAAKLRGKRLVFLAGNHDHHLVHRDFENRLEAQLAAGRAPLLAGEPEPLAESPGPGFFRSFLARRLPGVEIEIAYPTYDFAGVLLTHGHYLDPHARLTGSRGDRLLTRILWGIASGGPEDPKTIADYESTVTLLTEWLYIAAQMPHGTHAQQNVFRAMRRLGRLESALKLPLRGLRRLRGEEPIPGAENQPSAYPAASVISPSDPSEHALEAFAKVTSNLGWDREAERIVFAHTHQPLADVRCGDGSRPATGTPALGSTSPTAARARPTPATCATPGQARRSRSTTKSPSPACSSSSPISTRLAAAPGCPSRRRSAYLMNSISSYFGSGQRSSATIFSSLSAASLTASLLASCSSRA